MLQCAMNGTVTTQCKGNTQQPLGLCICFTLAVVHASMTYLLPVSDDITSQEAEHKDVERSIRNMQNDMLKLNLLLTKEGKTRQNLKQDNILIENDFILSLREAEMESIQMQNQLEGLGEEKERLLNSLVEAE